MTSVIYFCGRSDLEPSYVKLNFKTYNFDIYIAEDWISDDQLRLYSTLQNGWHHLSESKTFCEISLVLGLDRGPATRQQSAITAITRS